MWPLFFNLDCFFVFVLLLMDLTSWRNLQNRIRLFQCIFYASQWHINKTFNQTEGGNTYCWACSVRENSLFCQLHTQDSFIGPTRYTLLAAYSQLSTASCRMKEGASVPDVPMDCVYVCYSRAHSWEDGWSPPEAGCCCFAVFSVSSSSSVTSSLLLFPFCCILLCRSVTMAAMDLVGLWRRTQDKIVKLIINTHVMHKMIRNTRHT